MLELIGVSSLLIKTEPYRASAAASQTPIVPWLRSALGIICTTELKLKQPGFAIYKISGLREKQCLRDKKSCEENRREKLLSSPVHKCNNSNLKQRHENLKAVDRSTTELIPVLSRNVFLNIFFKETVSRDF
jgi:hypothetical protein